MKPYYVFWRSVRWLQLPGAGWRSDDLFAKGWIRVLRQINNSVKRVEVKLDVATNTNSGRGSTEVFL